MNKTVQIDSETIVRCQRGDKAAFRLVVQNCQRMVFSLSLKILADEEEAKDVVQETFLRVWQGIGRYDPQKPFATWLYTIATRLCLDRLKAAKLLCPLPDDERVLQRFASDADSHRTLENTEWMAIVRLLAEGLSEKQRCYALTSFLLVICPAAFRLQWNPIAHSKQQDICSKIKAVFIITLMTDSG